MAMPEAREAHPSGASRQAALGATPAPDGTRFRVWAPGAARVEVVIEGGRPVALARRPKGYHEGHLAGVGPGATYRYRVDGAGPFPDPASRFQPRGVHGPSEVVDPDAFAWNDGDYLGLDLERLVLYELHVGTFTPEGTFAAAARRLPHLAALGVAAVELMPVADFPGDRNWGYDGVSLFAPARCYGAPDDLRRLVAEAHRLGLGVVLDVVYNHLGPDGSYLGAFSELYFTRRHETPWGSALNLDGEGSPEVRALLAENAIRWIREYHLDGLRLDATHAIADDSPRHLLAEIAGEVRRRAGRPALLLAEDHRNLDVLVRRPAEGGYGLDGVWSDDLHHALRVRLAGDRDGTFADFSGSAEEIAETLRRGWLYVGQDSVYWGGPRGSDPAGLPLERFVVFAQNHDQVGNRAFGDRLHHAVAAPAWRAAVSLLLLAPETPLLFMGQEWAASTPFLYFTDHEPDLGRRVAEGRRRELARFRDFADPGTRRPIPDPQAAATFEASRLRWDEAEEEPHASVLRLHRALLALRRDELVPRRRQVEVRAEGAAVVLAYGAVQAVVQLEGAGEVTVPASGAQPRVLLSTEAAGLAADPQPPEVVPAGPVWRVRFRRPGAIVVRVDGPGGAGSHPR
ncbi:MAG TPA: malto-oligosyltrehalose trehalohydrolase [Anaeromyxobacteraceae bacterium]|jgi:maltooligosyltrehalose trehalohydrolase